MEAKLKWVDDRIGDVKKDDSSEAKARIDTALRDYTSAAGSLCREVLPRVIAPSGTFTGSTVACRRVDGRWYVLE